jgi:hypothetical protein
MGSPLLKARERRSALVLEPEPTLVAEVSYANMTANGLRAPVFRGFDELH